MNAGNDLSREPIARLDRAASRNEKRPAVSSHEIVE
jgi:hypothetical protein